MYTETISTRENDKEKSYYWRKDKYVYVSTNQQDIHNRSNCKCNPGQCTS